MCKSISKIIKIVGVSKITVPVAVGTTTAALFRTTGGWTTGAGGWRLTTGDWGPTSGYAFSLVDLSDWPRTVSVLRNDHDSDAEL
jgi:hypothetical protein